MILPKFNRGMRGYATVLRALMDEPCTSRALSERISLRWATTMQVLQLMRHRKLVHISGWVQDCVSGPQSAVWSAGNGIDAPRPPGVYARTRRFEPRTEMRAFVNVMEALKEPITAKQLAEDSGVGYDAICPLIAHMRKLHLIYIAAWDQTLSVQPVAMFKLGHKRQADRPQPRGDSMRNHQRAETLRLRAEAIEMIRMTARPVGIPATF